MRFSSLCLAATLFAPIAQAQESTCTAMESPYVDPKITVHGSVADGNKDGLVLADVMGCCSIVSPDNGDDSRFTNQIIGKIPQMSTEQTFEVLEDAKQAWKGGTGTWPQMSLKERLAAIEKFIDLLGEQREAIVTTLMWEIGKNRDDAEAEFDRTVGFAKQVIGVIRTDPDFASSWKKIGSTNAFVRRAAIGIIMCLGPMNYPLNETYATLIPALLMGNVCIMKIPTVGGLSHLLTSELGLLD